jgi:hypothetical protein
MRSYGVGVWKHIRRGWECFSKFLKFEVGDGYHISFWHNTWCGDQLLKVSYLELYRIARNKEAWVSDNMQILKFIEMFILSEKLKIGRWRW